MEKIIEEQIFFYFIDKDNFTICDTNCCTKSDRTLDISFFDLANNERLLNKIGLYFMQGNCVRYTYESRAKWFCGYISGFSNSKSKEVYEKLITNPTVRLLIENGTLLSEIKNILHYEL